MTCNECANGCNERSNTNLYMNTRANGSTMVKLLCSFFKRKIDCAVLSLAWIDSMTLAARFQPMMGPRMLLVHAPSHAELAILVHDMNVHLHRCSI